MFYIYHTAIIDDLYWYFTRHRSNNRIILITKFLVCHFIQAPASQRCTWYRIQLHVSVKVKGTCVPRNSTIVSPTVEDSQIRKLVFRWLLIVSQWFSRIVSTIIISSFGNKLNEYMTVKLHWVVKHLTSEAVLWKTGMTLLGLSVYRGRHN